MGTFSIDGPTDVTPELAMALFNAMPEVGRAGVSQMFASRLMSGPLSDKAIEAAARVYVERMKIGQAGAKALRDAVTEKCRALGEKSVNEQAVRGIVDDETRKASAEFAKTKVETLMSAIPLDALVAAATPAIEGVVRSLAHQYFTKTLEGQQWILKLIDKAKEETEEGMLNVMAERARSALDTKTARMGMKPSGPGDNGSA